MKTIKNRKFIRAPKFVCAVMLILLLSSLLVTTVWAIKPDKPPGKPSDPDPEPVIADYSIWIGDVGDDQDIILESPSPIFVVDVVGGSWLPPPTKRKAPKEMTWSIDLQWAEGYEFRYYIGDESLSTILAEPGHDIDVGTPSQFFSIEHVYRRSTRGGVSDYWLIQIAWQDGYLPDYSAIPRIHGIMCRTNIDAGWEGVYNEDTWAVTFDNAEAGLIENVDDSGNMVLLWEGDLSFTVTITRTNVVT